MKLTVLHAAAIAVAANIAMVLWAATLAPAVA